MGAIEIDNNRMFHMLRMGERKTASDEGT